ncbi:MAG: 2Fe-2S iron-sulfur cluster-binding protein [Planctomycetota bacterium]
MPKIYFIREQREIEVPAGTNLRKAARDAGIDIYYQFPGCPNFIAQNVANCHGFGLCGTCGVHLLEGTANNAEPAGMQEKMRVKVYDPLTPHLPAGRVGHENEFRLSCKTKVKGDLKVLTKPYNWFGKGTAEQIEQIGKRADDYDEKLKKKNPTQSKARELGITKAVRPEEITPQK